MALPLLFLFLKLCSNLNQDSYSQNRTLDHTQFKKNISSLISPVSFRLHGGLPTNVFVAYHLDHCSGFHDKRFSEYALWNIVNIYMLASAIDII